MSEVVREAIVALKVYPGILSGMPVSLCNPILIRYTLDITLSSLLARGENP